MELHGLRGIEPVRGNLIRPIIECKRDEIEKYCEIYNLDPKYDKTNNENVYKRNKINRSQNNISSRLIIVSRY